MWVRACVRACRYEITRCKALIELQTSSLKWEGKGEDGIPKSTTSNIRPNIYINSSDERELFICRDASKLNQTVSYRFAVNAPQVVLMYDEKKK